MSVCPSINKDSCPSHVAIIMDGNGRWAKRRNCSRTDGHIVGSKVAMRVAKTSAMIGVKYLTLYAFSNENWKRPIHEVDAIMNLLTSTMISELNSLHENNIRLITIGNQERLPVNVRLTMKKASHLTKHNTGMTLVLALSYSSRQDIVDAIKKIVSIPSIIELNPHKITENVIDQYLSSSSLPNPDLLIRTGGEKRLSNFLLWEIAYSELYFTNVLWPDFDDEELYKAIFHFQQIKTIGNNSSDLIQNPLII